MFAAITFMGFVPALIASIAKILICRGDTPIMWASTCNDLPAVKLLLKVLMASVQICYLRWWYHFCMRTTVILTYAGHAKLTNTHIKHSPVTDTSTNMKLFFWGVLNRVCRLSCGLMHFLSLHQGKGRRQHPEPGDLKLKP